MPVLKQLNERDPVLPVMVDDFVPASERCVNFTHSITAIIQQVESQTGAVKKILDGTDLEVSMLARHTTRTSCQHLEKVVRNTLNLMKDTDVALRAGRRMRVTSYGMYGYALLSSANFIDVSMVNNKYILSGSPFCQAPMILQGNGGYCTLTPRQWTDPADMAYRFSVEFALAAHLSVCRDVTGGRFGFSRVELAYPRPVYGDAYEQVLECPVSFDQEENIYWFEAPGVQDPLPFADARTNAMVLEICEKLLSELNVSGGVAADVRELLVEYVGHFPDLEGVAAELGMHPRALRRRLTNEDTSFRELLRDVRMRLAVEYLRKTELTNEEISCRLGYSDAANFRHAFKRWTGCSPSEYRGMDSSDS
ncbi:AraC family transcriptional regulator [Alloalcanivorax xenomutans]|jgi:AraC-like DNA-binding protein|uniref:AraC family transcriptional regulator n=1 Tax=Alloalcanivorax xenomutans TaxID=1094342 RepID=UPI0006D80FB5|nr:AraC family transcriptional regulator [Alloalcanivorax xenomutans]